MINQKKISYDESRRDPLNMPRDTYIRKKQSTNINQSMMQADLSNLDGSQSSETSFNNLHAS